MKKKILCIFLMTLLIATTLPAIGTLDEPSQSQDQDWLPEGAGNYNTIYHMGDVGIGIVSPLSKLHISGELRISDPNSNDYFRIAPGDGETIITHIDPDGILGTVSFNRDGGIDAEGIFSWQGYRSDWGGYYTNQGNFITDSGEIGIGVQFPSYKLDISAGTGIVARFSGRVIGADAINDDEFVTKSQVKSVVKNQLSGIMKLSYILLARNFIKTSIEEKCINPLESIMKTKYTPIGTNDSNGTIGDITYDNNYIYIKTDEGWKRSALETW